MQAHNKVNSDQKGVTQPFSCLFAGENYKLNLNSSAQKICPDAGPLFPQN